MKKDETSKQILFLPTWRSYLQTEDDFKELLELVEKSEFDRMGAFTYSIEEDTPAYDMEQTVLEEVKQERLDILMKLQSEISYQNKQDENTQYWIAIKDIDSKSRKLKVDITLSDNYIEASDKCGKKSKKYFFKSKK